jgi:hypothetical protein
MLHPFQGRHPVPFEELERRVLGRPELKAK